MLGKGGNVMRHCGKSDCFCILQRWGKIADLFEQGLTNTVGIKSFRPQGVDEK